MTADEFNSKLLTPYSSRILSDLNVLPFMPTKYLAFATLAVLALFSSAHAQVISLTSGALALDGSNILTVGPVVYAYNLDNGGSAENTTVNGITFIDSGTFSGTDPSTNFSIGGNGFDGTGGSGLVPNQGLSTQAVATLNREGVYIMSSFALNNLTEGTTYSLQLVIDAQTPDNRQVTYTDITDPLNPVSSGSIEAGVTGPQYIDEVFKATGTSEKFAVGGSGPNGEAQLSGFVLETPEPSTYAMMLGGLVLLAFCLRRKLA
jgi:hypothetical protein